MTLPKRPERSSPIPNQPFDSPEVTTIKGPYWDMPLGPGLEADGQGSVQVSGSSPSEPSAYLYGSSGFVGLGTGLKIGEEGEITACQQPPYGCNTYVNPYCVTNFTGAWADCASLTSFPPLNVSKGTTFRSAWLGCADLTFFPLLDVSNGVNFEQTWYGCASLTSFPSLDVSLGATFYYSWGYCLSLTSFPAGMFDNCPATDFSYAWQNCALSQQSVDNILISIDTAGQSNGTLGISGGTSSAPSAAGLAAKLSLEGKGWTVLTN